MTIKKVKFYITPFQTYRLELEDGTTYFYDPDPSYNPGQCWSLTRPICKSPLGYMRKISPLEALLKIPSFNDADGKCLITQEGEK